MRRSGESGWAKEAHVRTPEQWVERVRAVRGQALRIKVACIVWWDWFGQRLVSGRWAHLDELVNAYWVGLLVDPKDLERALVAVGYPVRVARKRAAGEVTGERLRARCLRPNGRKRKCERVGSG
jgi:hypothetical protein